MVVICCQGVVKRESHGRKYGIRNVGFEGRSAFFLDFDADVCVEFVESVLQAGEGREVWGLDVGEVRAWSVAFDEAQVAERGATGFLSIVQGQVFQITVGPRLGAIPQRIIPFQPLIESPSIDLLFERDFVLLPGLTAKLLPLPDLDGFLIARIDSLALLEVFAPGRGADLLAQAEGELVERIFPLHSYEIGTLYRVETYAGPTLKEKYMFSDNAWGNAGRPPKALLTFIKKQTS